jgi:ribosomal protein S18 acetylase RimI-like enzyme
MSTTPLPIQIRLLEKVEPTFVLEKEGYPADEAATPEKLTYRFQHAPELFLGAYLDDGTLVGYITSTAVSGDELTEASMSEHDPHGRTVCIHSVCVATAYRRRGIATALMKAYTQHLQRLNQPHKRYDRIVLLTHEPLIPFYQHVGYTLIGPSKVVHGTQPWFDMYQTL